MTSETRARTQGPARVEQLVERVLEAAAEPRYARLKDMWTRHHRLEKVEKAPVFVGIYVVAGNYSLVWQELIPPETLVSQDPLEREIEIQLRQKLYKHDHIPDDDVLLPTVWVRPARPGSALQPAPEGRTMSAFSEHTEGKDAARLWGLPLLVHETDEPGGAYKVAPVVHSEADMARLRHPRYEVDRNATRERLERATEFVGGRLPVRLVTDEVGFCPSETVVSLMGIEPILYGVIDRPEFIHRMMDFVTAGTVAYHQEREAAGGVEAESSWYYRAHYEELPAGADPRRLEQSWATISAQSLCGLSPAMYAEFLQPYHARMADMIGDRRVYYHACEDITAKIPIIKELPNLGRVHISPWTNLEAAVQELGGKVVLETDAHPADTIFVHTPAQMRSALERIMDTAGHCVMDINLTAIETVNGDPSVLTTWAEIAQEVTERYA